MGDHSAKITLKSVAVGLLALMCVRAGAADTCRDFLVGTGDFGKCTYTIRSGSLGGDQWGEPATPTDSVADGWVRAVGSRTPDQYVFNLTKVPGYQYMAVRNITSEGGAAELYTELPVNDSDPDCLHTGDQITLTIDKVRMLDWTGVGFASLSMGLGTTGGTYNKQVDYSAVDTSASYTMTVPAGLTAVRPDFFLYTHGDLGTHEPGVLLSGAHVTVVRSGQNVCETEQIPLPRNRNIRTNCVGWGVTNQGLRKVVANYDELTTHAWTYRYFAAARKYNPNAKLYLYQSGGTASDFAMATRWALSPMRLAEMKTQHPDWLYPDPNSADGYKHDAGYPDRAYVHVANASYQAMWAQGVIAKGTTLGVNGIWIDDLQTLSMANQGVVRDPWEVQNFIHAVVPRLRQAGLTSIVNNAIQSLDGSIGYMGNCGAVYFSPFWSPDSAHPASSGYTANTAENTPDVFYQEYAFMYNDGGYNSSYWLRCLNDASIIADWNSRLPQSLQKRIMYGVIQEDKAGNPAHGETGWLRFTFASYLLCQNAYTSYGASTGTATSFIYLDPGFALTVKLGDPDGTHQPYGGDQYVRYRLYKANSSGGIGGVAVVNGYTDQTKTYQVNFNALDENGVSIPAGTTITLQPHAGRILLRA